MPASPERVWDGDSREAEPDDPRRVRLRRGRGSADEARRALAEHGDDAKLLAGGMSLLPLMKLRLATPTVLVDVGRVRDLSYVRDDGDHVAIGALDPSPRPRDRATCSAASAACSAAVAARGRRQPGAPPRHDRRLGRARRSRVRPPGRAARARRRRSSRAGPAGERDDRRRPTSSSGFLETALAPDELLTEIRVPKTGAERVRVREVQPAGAGLGDRRRGRGAGERRRRASRSSTWAATPLRADRGRAGARRRRVGRRRRRARGRRHRAARRPQRVARVPRAPRPRARAPGARGALSASTRRGRGPRGAAAGRGFGGDDAQAARSSSRGRPLVRVGARRRDRRAGCAPWCSWSATGAAAVGAGGAPGRRGRARRRAGSAGSRRACSAALDALEGWTPGRRRSCVGLGRPAAGRARRRTGGWPPRTTAARRSRSRRTAACAATRCCSGAQLWAEALASSHGRRRRAGARCGATPAVEVTVRRHRRRRPTSTRPKTCATHRAADRRDGDADGDRRQFRVSTPIDETWKVLLDIERIAPCLPGAQLQEIEGDEYRGVVKVKVGPITAQYKGTAPLVEVDEAAARIVIDGRRAATRGARATRRRRSTSRSSPDGDGTDGRGRHRPLDHRQGRAVRPGRARRRVGEAARPVRREPRARRAQRRRHGRTDDAPRAAVAAPASPGPRRRRPRPRSTARGGGRADAPAPRRSDALQRPRAVECAVGRRCGGAQDRPRRGRAGRPARGAPAAPVGKRLVPAIVVLVIVVVIVVWRPP